MLRKCYSVIRIPIDENNDSVSKSWIAFRHRIVAKLTSAAKISGLWQNVMLQKHHALSNGDTNPNRSSQHLR